jgi:hypothetical protein
LRYGAGICRVKLVSRLPVLTFQRFSNTLNFCLLLRGL